MVWKFILLPFRLKSMSTLWMIGRVSDDKWRDMTRQWKAKLTANIPIQRIEKCSINTTPNSFHKIRFNDGYYHAFYSECIMYTILKCVYMLLQHNVLNFPFWLCTLQFCYHLVWSTFHVIVFVLKKTIHKRCYKNYTKSHSSIVRLTQINQ